MGLIRFIFRLILNLVGAVLILLLVGTIAAWFRGRWTSEEFIVSWVQHAPGGRDICHSTQVDLGGAIYVNDTEKVVESTIASDAFAEPGSAATQPTTAPTTQPVVVQSSVELQGIKRSAMSGSMAVSGPGDQPTLAALGFEYGDKHPDGADRFRWILMPYWILALALFIPVLLWMMLYSQGRKRRGMFCSNCQHDLSKPINRCPECGSPLAKPIRAR